MFSIKNGWKKGDALLPLLVNAAVDNAIWWVEVHPDGSKLNGMHQLQIYDDDNILVGSVHTIKKTGAVVVASKETGLEVNSDKTKYRVMIQDQNA
jgi:hypothetical protein